MSGFEQIIVVVGTVFILTGALFFTAGTLGLLRFPGIRNQLHALTKADNLGLGLVMIGTALVIGSWVTAIVLLLTWLMALGAASVSAHLIAATEPPNEPLPPTDREASA